MNKKMFILPLLVLVLMVGFSFSAFAEDTGIGLKVGTDEITTEKTSGDGWRYANNEGVPTLTITGNVTLSNVNPEDSVGIVIVVDGEYTVTLNNVNLKYVENEVAGWGSIIYFKNGGKLNLAKGTTNTLANFDNIADDEGEDAITFGGDLDISGGGSLNIDTSDGIYSSSAASLTIADSVINIKTTRYGIYANQGDVSISGSGVTITSAYDGISVSGNVSISDSNLIVRSVYPAIGSWGNITIKGKSVLDLKAVVPVLEESETTSGLSADEATEGPDMPMYSEYGVLNAYGGNIIFEGPVQVTADGSEYKSPIYGIVAWDGNIEFKLTPGGFVKGIGSDAMTTWYQQEAPAQGGIVALAGNAENADTLGKITLNDGNVITAPQGSTVVSGALTGGGFYQAIGTSEAVAQEAVVEYPTYDHMGYMEGYPEGDFRPAANLTRGECAMLFSRFSEDFDNTKTYPASFTDVKAGSWYANCIGYMEANDIIKGYEDKTFRPDTPITRAEFVALADRYFGLKISSGTLSFADVPQGHWAYDYIYTAQAENLIKGYSAELFGTDDYIKRGDVVLIINRALECDPDTVFIDANVKDMNTFTDVVKGETTDEYYYNILAAANSHRFYNNTEGKIQWLELIK